jgi:hypothetical protein
MEIPQSTPRGMTVILDTAQPIVAAFFAFGSLPMADILCRWGDSLEPSTALVLYLLSVPARPTFAWVAHFLTSRGSTPIKRDPGLEYRRKRGTGFVRIFFTQQLADVASTEVLYHGTSCVLKSPACSASS